MFWKVTLFITTFHTRHLCKIHKSIMIVSMFQKHTQTHLDTVFMHLPFLITNRNMQTSVFSLWIFFLCVLHIFTKHFPSLHQNLCWRQLQFYRFKLFAIKEYACLSVLLPLCIDDDKPWARWQNVGYWLI